MFVVPTRPNRLNSIKNEKYHSDYAKWCIGNVNTSNQLAFIEKSLINWAFYKGNQWLFAEDLDAFLSDESGDSRNRIKFIQNIIRPFVEYYTGSAIRMDISCQAFSKSTQAIDRREMVWQRVKAQYEIYKMAPQLFKPAIKDKYNIGETEQETQMIFKSMYKDRFEESVNDIMSELARRNDMEDKKVLLTKHIALDGIGVLFEEERFGSQVVNLIDSRRFFFDSSAKLPSLKDSEFMGHWDMMSLSDIAELCPNLGRGKLMALEKASALSRPTIGMHNMVSFEWNQSNGKIPVYNVEWRDMETDLFGACYDENGVPALVKIDSDDSPYTKKDLIPKKDLKKLVKDNAWIEKVLGFEQTKRVTLDAVRYCKLVPSEFIGSSGSDFVLKYGLKEYVPRYSYDYQYPDWSYKARCWNYDNGEVLSPIDDLISPQRFINRLLSIGESQINNVRGSGPIFSKDTIDSQGGEQELQRNVNLGKAVIIDGPVNNSVGTYSNGIGAGTIQLFDIASKMKTMADAVIGGGQELQGAGGSYRASASVANQNLNQGQTMQEPVFYCLHKIILDIYESFANRGRRILCANQSQLVVTVGEEGMKMITLTRDYDIEQYRCEVKRATDPHMEKQNANEMLMLLFEKQLIDSTTYAKYFNKSTMNTIGQAIREYTMLKIEAERQRQAQAAADEAKQKQGAQAAMQLQNMQQDQARQDAFAMEGMKQSAGQASVITSLLDKTEIPKGIE